MRELYNYRIDEDATTLRPTIKAELKWIIDKRIKEQGPK